MTMVKGSISVLICRSRLPIFASRSLIMASNVRVLFLIILLWLTWLAHSLQLVSAWVDVSLMICVPPCDISKADIVLPTWRHNPSSAPGHYRSAVIQYGGRNRDLAWNRNISWKHGKTLFQEDIRALISPSEYKPPGAYIWNLPSNTK